jgi:hypothetical protein
LFEQKASCMNRKASGSIDDGVLGSKTVDVWTGIEGYARVMQDSLNIDR